MPALFLYDSKDSGIAKTSRSLDDGGRNIISRGVTSFGDVLNILDRYIQQKQRFANIYFNTHGTPGVVSLPNGCLTKGNAHQLKTRKDIFDRQGRVLFMGCNVGEDDVGWRFLDAVGIAIVQNGFVGAATSVILGRGAFEPRMPRWGLLRIVQMKEGRAVRHTETGSLLAHALEWLFG